jgi:hypothetical protein
MTIRAHDIALRNLALNRSNFTTSHRRYLPELLCPWTMIKIECSGMFFVTTIIATARKLDLCDHLHVSGDCCDTSSTPFARLIGSPFVALLPQHSLSVAPVVPLLRRIGDRPF